LGTVPPLSSNVWQENTKQSDVEEEGQIAVAVLDQEGGKSNAHAEALLAIGVAILKVVVANFLVCQSFECFGDLDPVFVDDFGGQILGGVDLDLVGMLGQRQFAVMFLDGLFVRRLDLVSHEEHGLVARRQTYTTNAKDLIWVPYLGHCAGGNGHQIDHVSHKQPS